MWVFGSPAKAIRFSTSEGKTVLCTHLKDLLTIPEARIVKLIDLDLYPYKHFVGSGHCARTLFGSLTDAKTLALFRSAAAWRLKTKTAASAG